MTLRALATQLRARPAARGRGCAASRDAASCRIYYDLRGYGASVPQPGEFLATVGSRGVGSVYLITGVTRSTRAPHRFYLDCQRGYSKQDLENAPWVWWITWYKRERTVP